MSASDNVPYTPAETAVCNLLLPGAANAITIREVERLTRFDARSIKKAVEGLRLRHRVAVGSRRQKPCGLFILDTAQEIDDNVRTLMAQAGKMMRVARSLPGVSRKRIAEYAGQLVMELEP